jgi:hypothetical protein
VVLCGISVPVELGWALELAVWESFPVAVELALVDVVPPEFAVAVVWHCCLPRQCGGR